ncbi:hypothetical protein C8N36_10348 [Pelagimonas varians]|uniref:Uncharacterized protein n=1 Tax=Pelagimonas varians TaxID=696760 RepID=A0A238KGT8_9RHOB|nr:hypothetical protein C8N36_10348 [Pelagimonas varians]SMX41938.1 hypothetical protein PEV8663_02382 [Pelagimonas varians]
MQEHPTHNTGTKLTANAILIFANLLWVFLAVRSAWGFGAVLVLAATLNHLITRYDCFERRQIAGIDQHQKDTG